MFICIRIPIRMDSWGRPHECEYLNLWLRFVAILSIHVIPNRTNKYFNFLFIVFQSQCSFANIIFNCKQRTKRCKN